MKINIYVNWEEKKVYNEEDFLEEMQNEVNDNFNEWSSDWLNEEYTAYDLFYLTDSEKKEIEEKMKEELLEGTVDIHVGYDWEVATIDI